MCKEGKNGTRSEVEEDLAGRGLGKPLSSYGNVPENDEVRGKGARGRKELGSAG